MYASVSAWAAYAMILMTLDDFWATHFGPTIQSMVMVVLIFNIWSTIIVPVVSAVLSKGGWCEMLQFSRVVRIGVNSNHIEKVISTATQSLTPLQLLHGQA